MEIIISRGYEMKKMFWCVHHIIIDSDGYYESVKACSSKETAEKSLDL